MLSLVPDHEQDDGSTEAHADDAAPSGVRVFRDLTDNNYYATSVSSPGRFHRLTADGCDCPDYLSQRRCTHHAALVAILGQSGRISTGVDTVTVHRVGGYLAPGGWLIGAGHVEWHEPETLVAVGGVDKVRVRGEQPTLDVHWLEEGRPVEDLRPSTPAMLDHEAAVAYWVRRLGPAPVTPAAAGGIGIPASSEREAA
jgi:hypothetical protein